MAPETRFTRNGEVSIAYQVVGEGPLDLAFVPGFVSHVELAWEMPSIRRLFERLASFSRVILFDKREQGSSDRLGRPPTLEESMEDLRAVLNAAGSERTALLGVSEGGPMAVLLAASFPERCSHLVLYGTYARLTRAPDYPDGLPAELLDGFGRMIRDEWGSTPGMRFLAPGLVGNSEAERAWAKVLRLGTSPRSAAALMGLYKEIDVRDVLPLVSQPTLILHRVDDIAVPLALARRLADSIDGARLVEMPGRDHAWFAGDVDAFADEIEEFLTGTRSARPPERVLSTVLFTDIVASTERAAVLGDRRWRDVLDRHDELVRREIERHQGRPVKSTGDGFLATFAGPARAIGCAASVADQVRALGIEIRAGLHTGECELRGDDVGGLAVHIGARVASRARAGEVLVSGTVKDLVVGSGIEFEGRGTAELKGVPGEWPLYALAASAKDERAAEQHVVQGRS